MEKNSSQNTYYQGIKGGALPIDSLTYVLRDADTKLYEYLQDPHNRVCCILAARQMGKSSLMVKTAKRLTDDGILCVRINLQGFGEAVTEQALYYSILRTICQQLKNIDENLVQTLDSFWNNQLQVIPPIIFQDFIAEQIFQKLGNIRLIVFLDEIQSLVKWKLQNSFIGWIKSLSNEDKFEQLTFVVLGVVKPSDLITDASYALNIGCKIPLTPFSLSSLEEKVHPLEEGLKKASDRPKAVLKEILSWTGGQPFLTQVICYLVEKKLNLINKPNIQHDIGKLVKKEIINNWRNKDRQTHFQSIEAWFKTGYSNTREKIAALNLYKKMLQNPQPIVFDSSDEKQMNLIISGLVAKLDDFIKITNQIYREIFNSQWIQDTQEFIKNKNKDENMVSTEIFNRDVYILVDQSDSMNTIDDPDLRMTRWEFLKEETLKGDVRRIMTSIGGKKICEKINLYLFSRRKVGLNFLIEKADEIDRIFEGQLPDSSTFISKTLQKCLNDWFENGRKKGKKAFIIIYTDGELSDRPIFEKIIRETCQKLKNQNELKIIIIGVGKEIHENKKSLLEYWIQIDRNLRDNKDLQGNHCDIIGFDLADRMNNIIDTLDRELIDDPAQKKQEWLKEYPDLSQKYSS